MQAKRIYVAAACLLILLAPNVSRAADVLKNLPTDALGFVLARNFAAVDRKSQQLIGNLQLPVVSPLAFLQGAMAIREGLDTSGDLLLAVLPPQEGGDRPQFCIWLPVADYEGFVAALGGSPAQKVTAVTVAGEDLLVARHEKWALVMDPDQRQRMEELLDAAPPRQPDLEWINWIDTQDLAIVALSAGVRDALMWAMSAEAAEAVHEAAGDIVEDDLFGPAEADDPELERPSRRGSSAPMLTQIQLTLRQWLARSPKALEWAHDVEAIGLGLRLDDEGNAHAGIRATMGANSDFVAATAQTAVEGDALAALYQGGDFIVTAAGALPRALTGAAVSAYVRSIIDEMKTEERLTIDEATLARFYQEVEKAADMVESIAVFATPGNDQDGVYTNQFLTLRVASTESFVDHAGEVMRLWNQLNREAERGTQLVFDVEDVTIGERSAKEYSIDIAAADGGPALPEIRQAMEKLFGPGGKLRMFIVPVDERTALLAAATSEQIAGVLQTLDEKQPNDWNREPLGLTNRLLPHASDWRVFVSPNGYTRWHARQMNAITGPVFGGPLVKQFPASPPLGAAGGIGERGLWADFVVPAQTVRALGIYRQPKGIRLQR
jgi:hypothetical protein